LFRHIGICEISHGFKARRDGEQNRIITLLPTTNTTSLSAVASACEKTLETNFLQFYRSLVTQHNGEVKNSIFQFPCNSIMNMKSTHLIKFMANYCSEIIKSAANFKAKNQKINLKLMYLINRT
jgi:hypothetical protein